MPGSVDSLSGGPLSIRTTSPLSDADLYVIAGQYAEYTSKFLIAEVLMYGAFVILVLFAVFAVLSRSHRSAQAYWLLTALIATYIAATILCALDIAGLMAFYRLVFINGSSSVQERFQTYNEWYAHYQLQTLRYWIGSAGDTGFLYIVSDILASWRAVMLWQNGSRRILALVQGFLIFSASCLWMASAVIIGTMDPAISELTGLPGNDLGVVNYNLIIASSAASIAANVVATSMIAYTAYNYRRNAASGSGTGKRGVRLLALLTESGLIYAMIQITRLGLMLTPREDLDVPVARCAFQSATQIVTAMYAPALIMLIHHGYSINGETQFNSLGSGNASRTRENTGAPLRHASNSVHLRRHTDGAIIEITQSTSTVHSLGDQVKEI